MTAFFQNLFKINPDWQTFIAILGVYGIFEFFAGKKLSNSKVKAGIIVLVSFLAPLLSFNPTTQGDSLPRWIWAAFFAVITILILTVISIFTKITIIRKVTLDGLNEEINKLNKEKIELEKRIDAISRENEDQESYKISFNRESESILIDEQVEIIERHHLSSNLCPPLEQALEYILDRMMTTVLYTTKPEQFRVCVAQPLKQGNFRVLASRNTLFERIVEIQKDANWSKGISLFALGFYSTSPLIKLSETKEHYHFKNPHDGYHPSEVHLIIPLINEVNVNSNVFERCLAVLTIGALDKELLSDHSQAILNLQPQLNGMKRILKIYSNPIAKPRRSNRGNNQYDRNCANP